MGKHTTSRIATVGALLIAVWSIQVGLGYIDGLGLGPLSIGVFAVGVISFYGFYSAGLGMRATITASFVSVYLALIAAFLTSGQERLQIKDTVGENVWENFTWLVGTIVISYFGASVASEAIGAYKAKGHPAARLTTADSAHEAT